MSYSTEAGLHTLLDSLTDGEHIKATWAYNTHVVTVEGLVYKDDLYCSCFHTIRCTDGSIESALTSLEVARNEEVTVTRDDEEALHALLDSLEDGQEVTAEWRGANGLMILTAPAASNGAHVWVRGFISFPLRRRGGTLLPSLRSVTVRRPVVQRWGREDGTFLYGLEVVDRHYGPLRLADEVSDR